MSDECAMGFCYRGAAPNSKFCDRHKETEALRAAVATLTSERDAARRERDEARQAHRRDMGTVAGMAIIAGAPDIGDFARRALAAAPPTPPVGTPTDVAMPPAMLVTFPRIRQLPYRVARYTPDWWPICPHCDENELFSLAVPASTDTITGCYRCGECNVALAAPAVQGEPPRCREWCGSVIAKGYHHEWEGTHWLAAGRCFCTLDCRDAGKPLHPREGEQGRWGRCGTCGDSLPVRPNYGYVATTVDGRVVTVPCPACRGARPPQETSEGRPMRDSCGYPKKDEP